MRGRTGVRRAHGVNIQTCSPQPRGLQAATKTMFSAPLYVLVLIPQHLHNMTFFSLFKVLFHRGRGSGDSGLDYGYLIRTNRRSPKKSSIHLAVISLLPNTEHEQGGTITQQDEEELDEANESVTSVEGQYASWRLFDPWLPQSNPESRRANSLGSWRKTRKVVLWTQVSIALLVLIFNGTWTIQTARTYTDSDAEDTRMIYTGDCDTVAWLNAALHVLINLLSTLLLGSSNYCMQILVAPSREDLRKAHSEQDWMDVGIPSFRNLARVKRERAAIWLILGTCSVRFRWTKEANNVHYRTLLDGSTSSLELGDLPFFPLRELRRPYRYLRL